MVKEVDFDYASQTKSVNLSDENIVIVDDEAIDVGEQYYSDFQIIREQEFQKLNETALYAEVSRENIFEDMINLYKKRNTVLHKVNLSFKNEEAVGDGITKDAFSSFFEALYEVMEGYNQKVPSSKIDDDTLVVVGKICSHAFLNCSIFPVQICKSAFKKALFGEVDDAEILSSFLEFIQPNEKQLVENFSRGKCQCVQSLLDMLLEYSITEKPNKSNITDLMTKAGKIALIRTLYLSFQKIVEGMGNFWKNTSVEAFDSLFSVTIPNPEKVIEACISEETCAKDSRITTWIHRYLRACTKKELLTFCRFVTGSSTLPPSSKIRVQFVDQSSTNLHSVAQTCFKILTLPRQYSSFTELNNNLNFYFSNSDMWAVHDAL